MRNSYLPKKAAKKEQEITQLKIRNELYRNISEILQTARQNAYRAVNFVMVEAYWNIGKLIVEEEQQGKQRADYGIHLVKNLSVKLNSDFGKGFSEQSLWNMRLFYLKFPILSALRRELTWTHYKILLRIANKNALSYYIQEAAEQNWSVRALERQINSLYYERILTSRNKAPVIEEMQEKTATLAQTPQDFIKDPYVLEFIGMPDSSHFRVSDLEQVRLLDDTVWLTQKVIAELFQKDVRTINEHINNIFEEGELIPDSVIREFRITAADGKNDFSEANITKNVRDCNE